VWLPDDVAAGGYAVAFPSVVLHAVSREGGAPCILAQLDGPPPGAAGLPAEEEEEAAEASTQLRLVPADPESRAQSPHPCAGGRRVPRPARAPDAPGLPRSGGHLPRHVRRGGAQPGPAG